MILRAMSEDDIDSVYDIERAVNEFPWSLQQFVDTHKSNPHCNVVCAHDTVVAYSMVSTVMDEATLLNIAVSPDYQRRGYARELLCHVLTRLSEETIAHCFLEVREGNRKAIALYQSLGFQHISTRKNYYPAVSGREHAWVMCRKLPTTDLGGI